MSTNLLTQQFNEALNDCRHLYVDKAVECVVYRSDLNSKQRSNYLDEVETRFNRLLIKIFVEIAWSDCVWSSGEASLAKSLMEDLLRKQIRDREVRPALEQLSRINHEESWQSVLEPFTLLEELDQHRVELEAGLMRMANIVAKIDGNVTHETLGQLKNLKWQVHQFLAPPREMDAPPKKQPAPKNGYACDQSSNLLPSPATKQNESRQTSAQVDSTVDNGEPVANSMSPEEKAEKLKSALLELDDLIGIDSVKKEVQGLVNFLKVQAHRKSAGLPENQISLHMVFEGNPGTGKTTVARILGRVFGAMGVLEKGHLIETDRSGLVAEYVGQTATKANAIIDEALDGVLFIDEAYSLVSEGGKDPYGAEALQILLKRAEDDRHRLIVILAGYAEPMNRLLESNPGLSSRFARTFDFPDYSPEELCEIFQMLAANNHYKVTDDVREKLLSHLATASQNKDEHFGNGRLVRNLFENAMRRLADRVVDVVELTPELLTTFQPSDLELD